MDTRPIQTPPLGKSHCRISQAVHASTDLDRLSPVDESHDDAAPAIRDEAFARFTRIDAPQRATMVDGNLNGGWRATNQQLVSELATQLEALDRQREQLARLLEQVTL